MTPQSSPSQHDPLVSDAWPAADLRFRFAQVRQQTEALIRPLSAEDCALQSMPDASPAKWHLAHTSWFFETFVLQPTLPGYALFNPQFRVLFNSYYVAVGPRHPRPQRGLLSRPSLEEVLAYRRHVDDHLARLLEGRPAPAVTDLIELGLHHEQQHQELILTDIKHLLSHNPLMPVYAACPAASPTQQHSLRWLEQPDGIRQIGHAGVGFCFDNEMPRHRVFLDAHALASHPVTNGEYADFIADRGYERAELWLSEGWELKTACGWQAPMYWNIKDECSVFTLSGLRRLDRHAPVCHVSYFEADAYARWAGARLPTEAEWETVAALRPVEGNFLENGHFQPTPPRHNQQPVQVYGDVWEWTSSSYSPYPGYNA